VKTHTNLDTQTPLNLQIKAAGKLMEAAMLMALAMPERYDYFRQKAEKHRIKMYRLIGQRTVVQA
jgi:hypothetical protein